MFGIGTGEFIVIAVVLLIAVGPRRLPTLMKSAGRALREFRKAANDLRRTVGIDDLLADEEPRPRVRPDEHAVPVPKSEPPPPNRAEDGSLASGDLHESSEAHSELSPAHTPDAAMDEQTSHWGRALPLPEDDRTIEVELPDDDSDRARVLENATRSEKISTIPPAPKPDAKPGAPPPALPGQKGEAER